MTARLDEFDMDEWREVARVAMGADFTEKKFQADWVEFLEMKAKKELQ